MRRTAVFTILVLLSSVGAAMAQTGSTVHGHEMTFAGDTLVLRGDDGFTYTVKVRPEDAGLLGKVGQPLTVVGQRGAQPHRLTATQVNRGQGPHKAWDPFRGRVVSVTGSMMVFDVGGSRLDLDISPMKAHLQPKPGESATVLVEASKAYWMTGPAATPVTAGTPVTADSRVHGHELSFAGDTLMLRGDDGYTYTVKVRPEHAGLLGKVGQGLTVVGQPGTQPRTLTATQVIQEGTRQTWETARGRVVSVAGSMMTLDVSGNAYTIDISPIKNQLQFKPGDSVSMLLKGSTAVWATGPGVTQLAAQPPTAAVGGATRIEGHILDVTDRRMIVHTNDGRFQRVQLGAIPANVKASLAVGQGIVVDGSRDANTPHQFVASSVTPQAARKRYRTVSGTVESISGNNLTLRRADGRVASYDLSEMPGWQRRSMDVGEAVTLVHERGRERTVLWLDTTPTPSALPRR